LSASANDCRIGATSLKNPRVSAQTTGRATSAPARRALRTAASDAARYIGSSDNTSIRMELSTAISNAALVESARPLGTSHRRNGCIDVHTGKQTDEGAQRITVTHATRYEPAFFLTELELRPGFESETQSKRFRNRNLAFLANGAFHTAMVGIATAEVKKSGAQPLRRVPSASALHAASTARLRCRRLTVTNARQRLLIDQPDLARIDAENRQTVQERAQPGGSPAGGFRFPGSEVYIRRIAQTGDVILSTRPGWSSWDEYFALRDADSVPADFLADRRDETPQPRELFEDR